MAGGQIVKRINTKRIAHILTFTGYPVMAEPQGANHVRPGAHVTFARKFKHSLAPGVSKAGGKRVGEN
jgi:hypothetical protein